MNGALLLSGKYLMSSLKAFWKELHTLVRIATILGVVLALYGKFAMTLKIYFFWESYDIGCLTLIASIGTVLLVELLIKLGVLSADFRSGWRTAFHILIIALTVSINVIFISSKSLQVAKVYIVNNDRIKSQIGVVKGFSFLATGSSSSVTTYDGTSEYAVYQIVTKGSRAFAMVTIAVSRKHNGEWEYELREIVN